MCKFGKKISSPKVATPAPMIIAAPQNLDANRQADAEARLRRARSGAAANVLTSAMGIPAAKGATSQLGAPA